MDIDPLNIESGRAVDIPIEQTANWVSGIRIVVMPHHRWSQLHLDSHRGSTPAPNHFKGTGFRGNYDSPLAIFPIERGRKPFDPRRHHLSSSMRSVGKSAFTVFKALSPYPWKKGCGLSPRRAKISESEVEPKIVWLFSPTPAWGLWHWSNSCCGPVQLGIMKTKEEGLMSTEASQLSHSEHVQSLLSLLTYPS